MRATPAIMLNAIRGRLLPHLSHTRIAISSLAYIGDRTFDPPRPLIIMIIMGIYSAHYTVKNRTTVQ